MQGAHSELSQGDISAGISPNPLFASAVMHTSYVLLVTIRSQPDPRLAGIPHHVRTDMSITSGTPLT